MKKIFLTGANGFLGANLVRALVAEGYHVTVFVRDGANLDALADVPYHVAYGCIDNRDEVLKGIAGHQYVVHSASITGQYGISFAEYERINVDATKYVVEACLKHKVEKLVYVSTANTMAPGSLAAPGSELNGFSYFKANSGYINSKYLAQQFVLENVLQKKLPAVVVNPTFMIGAYDSKPSSGQIIFYGLHKRVLFYPPGGKSFVHISDVCKGITEALVKGEVGGCYLLAGENLSYRDFFRVLNKVTNQHPVMIRIPTYALKAAAFFTDLLQRIKHKSYALNKSSAYMLCSYNYYSGKKSERELGLVYKPVSDAISEAYEWFSKTGMLTRKDH